MEHDDGQLRAAIAGRWDNVDIDWMLGGSRVKTLTFAVAGRPIDWHYFVPYGTIIVPYGTLNHQEIPCIKDDDPHGLCVVPVCLPILGAFVLPTHDHCQKFLERHP